ncbi:MAG: (deoxy)nucleoside triphosphate pyrophosphohydrolase [Oligoflexia bacterium]|nr:(deoxy)nucleoside triphosphate pyrophosphohydrolase [Oligoflexia bacterium]
MAKGKKNSLMNVVAGVIYSDDGKILIAKRGVGMRFSGKWEFPGGKVEHSEDFESALKREIQEEFGVDIKVGGLLLTWRYHYDFSDIDFTAYSSGIVSGDITLREHSDINWVELNELSGYDLLPADRVLLEYLQEEVK